MPTDAPRRSTAAAGFALRGVAWSLGLLGLLRLTWTEAHLVLPLARLQGRLAVWLVGASALPVEVTLACSGTDALALGLGAILAYPARWGARLAGAAGGVALILGLNTLRIGSLGRAAGLPARFDALHLYFWPAALTLAIAGYVFAWMRFADRPRVTEPGGTAERELTSGADPRRLRRFVLLTGAFLLVFVVASPFYLESSLVLALAGFIARATAAILGTIGIEAHAAANVLWTSRGGFLVTQECVLTPLIPVYLAAVAVYWGPWRRQIVGVFAALPLFTALGIARLLVIALPEAVTISPLFLVHAFYQLLLGAVVVLVAARWSHGGRFAPRHALLGVCAGVLFVLLLGPALIHAIRAWTGDSLEDPQGAVAFLPAFQLGLYLALSVAAFVALDWKRFLAGLAVLGLTLAGGLLVLHALSGQFGWTAHAGYVRAWAVAGPVLIFSSMAHVVRTSR